MLTIISATDDISDSYERGTMRITEQLNNRRHACMFSTVAQRIDEGKKVYIYDTMELRAPSTAGTDTLFPVDTYEFQQKYRAGDIIYVDINGAGQRRYTIESVDHVDREIVLTQNLAANVTVAMLCGKRIFGGVSMKPSEEEVGNDNTFIYSHSLQDWSVLFDLKNVATTFVNQYPREIFGRVLRSFVAFDSRLNIDAFDAAWTHGGTARAMLDETDDVIEGLEAQKTGVTGSGSATWTKALSTIDLTAYEHLRFWWKMADGDGVSVTALKIRVGNDSSNYQEYDVPHVGTDFEDCWSYESVILAEPSATVGTPDMETVDWAQIVVTANTSIASGGLLFDHLHATTGGFTIVNVARGVSKFETLPAAFIKPLALVEDIAKRQSMYWFIDREKDLHLFTMNAETAPFDINTTDQTWGSLEIERDLETLRNRVPVRGADTISENQHIQSKVADGTETSFRLDYKPSQLSVFVANWNGSSYDAYVEKTVGIENLDTEGDFDFMMSFQEKFVRNSTFPTLDALDKIKFEYYPYIPVSVQVIDTASVAQMKIITGGDGIYDAPMIVDERIKDFNEARKRAQVELDLYSNAVVTCTFQTNKEGLHAGQIISITDPARNVDDDFVIQRLTAKTYAGVHDDTWSYDVTASTSMFGLIEFFQLLMKRSNKIPGEITESVYLLANLDDVLELADSIATEIKSLEFEAGDLIAYQIAFGHLTPYTVSATGGLGSGLRPSWYVTFSGTETGEVGVVPSNYNTQQEMYLEAATGGSGNAAMAATLRRYPVNGGEDYTIKAWIEILNALTNVGTGGGFRLRVIEYSAAMGGSALQTTTIFSGHTSARDFSVLEDTHTMHASATHAVIELAIYQAAGIVSVGEVHLIESAVDSYPNPAVASFSEAS